MANPNYLTLSLLLITSFGLSACPASDDSTKTTETTTEIIKPSDTPEKSPGEISITPSKQPVGQETPAAAAQVYKGIYVYGEGFQTFRSCNAKEEIWVIDTPSKTLEKGFATQQFMELEPVYVELEGSIGPAPKEDRDSFAADYSKAIKVTAVNTMEPWLTSSTCFDTDFIAVGQKPAWKLKATRNGDIFFKSNEGEYPIVETLAYSAPVKAGNEYQYSFNFRTPDEDKLGVKLTEGECQNAGVAYAYTAQVKFRGTTYTGCANKK